MNLQAMLLAHADMKRVTDRLDLFTLGLWSVSVLWVRCEPTGWQGPAIPGAHFLNVFDNACTVFMGASFETSSFRDSFVGHGYEPQGFWDLGCPHLCPLKR